LIIQASLLDYLFNEPIPFSLLKEQAPVIITGAVIKH
jgi:hypothetical protein